MPARFLFYAGQIAKIWNKKMLDDSHLTVIGYFGDSKDVFPSVGIKGGVAILLSDDYTDYGSIKKFIPNELLRSFSQHFHKMLNTTYRLLCMEVVQTSNLMIVS